MVMSVKHKWLRISICGSTHKYPDWLFTTGSCTIMTGAPGFNYHLNIYIYEVFFKLVLLHEFWWNFPIFIASPDASNTSNQAEQLFMQQNNKIYRILSAICDNYVYYYFM